MVTKTHSRERANSVAGHAVHFSVGFLSRPCCSIPAALALLGAGGTGIAGVLVPYRLWFMLAAAAFFGASFYWNFIRNRNRAGIVVWGVSVALAVGFWTVPLLASAPRSQFVMTTSADKNMMTTTIDIDGMACQACVRRVERTLKSLSGVHDATVNLAEKQATVAFDPSRIDVQLMLASIRESGFRPTQANASE